VDGNEAVNAEDAYLVLRFAVGLDIPTENQQEVADVDKNGKINSRDALFILLYEKGLIAVFPKPIISPPVFEPISVHVSAVEQQYTNDMVVTLILERPEGTATGDMFLTCEPAHVRITDVWVEGLFSEALSVIQTNASQEARMSFVASDAEQGTGQIVLHMLLSNSQQSESVQIRFTGQFYSAQGLSVGEVGLNYTVSVVPNEYALLQNYPNPFNPMTSIRYFLPQKGSVALSIYNLAGQLVRTLVKSHVEAGNHAVEWDGKDEKGQEVGAGVFLYRLVVDDGTFIAVRRMVLLK